MKRWIQDNLPWLSGTFLDNPTWLWAAAGLLTLAVFIVLLILRKLIVTRLKALAAKSKNKVDDAIADVLGRTNVLFLLAIAVLTGAQVLELGTRWNVVEKILVIVALVQAGSWSVGILILTLARWREKKEDASAKTVLGAMTFLGKIAVWSVVLLLALQNLGVDISALLTVGGISGIAVALAVQGVLKDLLASISILLDKPFQVGDFIIVGDHMGTVENIGLKTTRVKSLSGEQIVFANDDLLGSRIRNYKRMKERRIVFTVGVTYQTPAEKVERIPGMIREAVEAQENVRFDRAHFKAFGASSLDFETVYHMTDPDYAVYMDRQQAINLALYRKFEEEKIDFAYPTQTLFIEKSGEATS